MKLQLLLLDQCSILEQLQLEEALLRADDGNWCIINVGSEPSVVMGISGKPCDHINYEQYRKYPVPVIRRFSGGGTVVVDADTIFVSFIISKNSLDLGVDPQAILQWSMDIYRPAFHPVEVSCRENDYVIGERKIGGNAHYFAKNRWVHHTTFLWNFNKELMHLLLEPNKRPHYRGERNHFEFIDTLSTYFHEKQIVIDRLITSISSLFDVGFLVKKDLYPLLQKEYRKSVESIEIL